MSYSTVRAISAPELVLLRTEGQWSKLFLAYFKPSAVYTARLATLPDSNDRVTQISFTSGSGTLANVLVDMTMYVGSSAGAYDLGMVRIRKTPIAGVFYIGEESEVMWEADAYLTVVNEFDLWAKHITTVDDETFYIDTDVVYTNQNSVFNPVPVMGSHRVLKLTGATVATQFNWTNSYCIDSSISSYSATCATASAVVGNTTGTPTFTFNATGWHMVVLTVTAANGKTSFGVRYVYVYNDANPPSTVFQLESCHADYDAGGWSFTATVQDEVGLGDVPERTLCILFSEDYYGDEQVSVGQLSGCENIICIGKIAEERVSINPEQSEATLTVHGMHYWLNQTFAFPTGVIITTSTPTLWTHMQSPTVDKVLFRLFYWGTTATKMMDIYLTNDSRLASELISPASNLWAQIQEIAFTTIYARTGVDKFGRFFCEVEPQVVLLASRTWATVLQLTTADWYESVRMQRNVVSSTGMVNSSGVLVQPDSQWNAYFSLSPGHIFKRYGSTEVIDRMLVSSQTSGNQFASMVLGWRNNPYPNSEFTLSSNNRMIDCFPRQRIQWAVDAADTPRGFSFDTYFIPRRVEFGWSGETGFLETAVSLEMESELQPYSDGDVPGDGDVPIDEPPEPEPFPPLPDFPVITGGDIPTDISRVLLYSNTYGFLYTDNFDDADPTWEQANAGLGATNPGSGNPFYQDIEWAFVTPGGAVYAARLGTLKANPPTSATAFIYRAPSIGEPFVAVVDANSAIFAGSPPTFGFWGILTIGQNVNKTEEVVYVLRHGSGPVHQAFIGSGSTFTAGATGIPGSGGGDNSPIGMSFGFGKWHGVYNDGFFRLSADALTLELTQADSNIGTTSFEPHQPPIVRAGGGAIAYIYSDANDDFVYTPDNFTTRTRITVADFAFVGLACDPSGKYLMTRFTAGLGQGRKSSDYGSSWSNLGGLPAGTWRFLNAGTSQKWIAAYGTSVRYTTNSSDWVNKEGNLIEDFALTDIEFPVWYGL